MPAAKKSSTIVASKTENEAVAVQTKEIKPLAIAMAVSVTTTEMNNEVADKAEDQIVQIRTYLRGRILKQFGVNEVNKTAVQIGNLYFNGNRTPLTLPKVKETPEGGFAESVEQYYERVRPDLQKWLAKAMQNASITQEMVAAI